MKKAFAWIFRQTVICLLTFAMISGVTVFAADNNSINSKYLSTGNYLSSLPAPSLGSVGGEWLALGLARSSFMTSQTAEAYYQNVVDTVKTIGKPQLHRAKSTENSRVVLALTSIGKDVTNVGGYNLLEPLADFSFLKKQGINGSVWALIAFDSNNYKIPDINSDKQVTREALIDYILDAQLPDGGWSIAETDPVADDMTAMAVQSLAPYYNILPEVKPAVDRALELFPQMFKNSSPETCAQQTVALTSLGLDPQSERFLQDGKSVIDEMLRCSVNNGFSHFPGEEYDQMSTEQAFYALTSVNRLQEDKTSLYDMTDVFTDSEDLYDVNLDGCFDINDCTAIQKQLARLDTLSLLGLKKSDANRDRDIDISDVTFLQKRLAKII